MAKPKKHTIEKEKILTCREVQIKYHKMYEKCAQWKNTKQEK